MADVQLGNGKMSEITTTLLNKWSDNVGLNIQKQIQEYGKEVEYLNSSAPSPYQFKR